MADYAYLLENRLSLNQRAALAKVRDIAREHGMTVFLTGGAVRDLTTGFPVRDLDITVQGNPLKLKKSLEKSGAEIWGEYEPTRTLFLWFKGVRIEVSSARREDYPKPGKPVYHWAPILEDLRRRDFTANAMAVSLNEGSYGLLLDPLNGIADIESRTLRIISPYGFIEDPSRLLRAVRLAARTGWEMDERTRTRYQNAKEEDAISALSSHLKGYELEEIVHEEDALKALKALESEGWMKHIFPAWTSAKADARGLEALHNKLFELMMQGIHPDLSSAHMELLTAKLTPKDRGALKRLFPQPGFIKHWEHLDRSAKEFQTALLDKKNAAPSAAWKLLTSYEPEPVLWLAYTSKNAPVQTRFKNFATVWPEARKNIPTALMLEMRIAPGLPGYEALVEEIFFALMDGKLGTEEAMRAFLEPHSPPAPPPPVSVRRTRAKRVARIEEEEHDDHAHDEHEDHGDLDHDLDDLHGHGEDEDHDEDEEHGANHRVKPTKAKKEPRVKPAPVAKALVTKAVEAKVEAKAKPAAPAKAAPAKTPAKTPPKAPAKAAAKPAPAKAPAKKPVKQASKPAKPASKPAKKPTAKPSKKPVAKKPAKPAKKPAKKKR